MKRLMLAATLAAVGGCTGKGGIPIYLKNESIADKWVWMNVEIDGSPVVLGKLVRYGQDYYTVWSGKPYGPHQITAWADLGRGKTKKKIVVGEGGSILIYYFYDPEYLGAKPQISILTLDRQLQPKTGE